jgi:adenine-specific DNA-methyltransferase
LLDTTFEKENYITTIASESNPQGRVANKVSQTSEYHIIHAKNLEAIDKLFVRKLGTKKPSPLKRTGTNSRREERPNRYYPILLKAEKIFMISIEEYQKIYDSKTLTFNDKFVTELEKKYTKTGYKFILPLGESGEKLVWQRTFKRVLEEKDSYIVKNGNIFTPAFDIEIPKTLWKHPLYSNPEYGSEYLTNMLGSSEFETPKSYHAIIQFLTMAGGNQDSVYLDYFGGSGTTAQAVIELNKLDEEEGQRKYLIVEMGNYFYSVLLPRLKKLSISNKWKNAKPLDSNGKTQFFKYYELEQYEEALNNCKYDDSSLLNSLSKTPYQEYVFMKDEKMLKALEIDYEKEKVKVNLTKLYPNIDIAETLSNLTGKWIKNINNEEVEFEDGTKINTKDLDYKLIKPLIWWE